MLNHRLFLRQAVVVSVAACAFSLFAADVSGRKMVWAHYVPWLTPDNASQMSERFYDFPQFEVGTDPFRAEIERAMAEGIDGFFNDMVAHKGGVTSFWDLRPFLKAAEGTPFQFGICLDAKIPVEQQVKELVKMLSTYGNHPNYPKWGDRYVVDTYTFFAWSPEEWRAIRKGCAEAGYPIWVIANIETGYTAYSDAKLDPYAGVIDCAYFFSNNGAAFVDWKPMEAEHAAAAAWCARHGAKFMPCLWPGYYGGWLNGRCCYYQPFLGFDALMRRWDSARALGCDWLHVTTWNDHDETTLQSRRLTTGNPAIIKAMSDAHKGRSAAARTDVQFAYLRETLPGTLLRIETMRLPSADNASAEV
ncbi:MAG: laminin G, partial [bacterium]|nr:laminin G [Candidatus Colisoma equi]